MTVFHIFARLTLVLVLAFAGGMAIAAEEADPRARIAELFPEVNTENINPSPIAGILEVRIGPQVAYVSADGRFLIQGDIFDLDTEQNLTEVRRSSARLEAVADIGEDQMIVFAPEKVTHTVTVFTDLDCGYCRKLHRQMSDYHARGIEVRYMFFPRSGPATESWSKAERVWCAEDRKSALTRAKLGETIESEECSPTPVALHYVMGQKFGVRGTPAILTETGELLGGYLPPDDLAEYLDGIP
jgi:thiol:disulfide interchange protein DsbC